METAVDGYAWLETEGICYQMRSVRTYKIKLDADCASSIGGNHREP